MRFIKGLIYGAALMYFFDPDRGRSRRAHIRDKALGFRNELGRRARGRVVDARNRLQGTVAEMRGAGRSRRGQQRLQRTGS
jgi:hypothetical protein